MSDTNKHTVYYLKKNDYGNFGKQQKGDSILIGATRFLSHDVE